jgi:hypothetical protein
MDDLKGFQIGGYYIVAKNEVNAIEMYIVETGHEPHSEVKEVDIDDSFMYFDINEIREDDICHIYDRKYPDGKELVSLKRPYARKYCPDGFCDKPSISMVIY